MRVLLYEPNHSGHHFPYLARMLPGLVDLPIDLVLATSEQAVASKEFDKHLAVFADRLVIDTRCVVPSGSPKAIASARVTEVVDLAKDIAADHVFLLYADGLWQIMATRRMRGARLFEPDVTVEGILYRGGFTYPKASGLRAKLMRFLFRRLLKQRQFDRLLFNDEYLFEYAQQVQGDPPATGVSLTADPVAIKPMRTKTDARADLNLPHDGQIVSLIGGIDRRKGADLLIGAFIRAVGNGLAGVRLLLAGPHRDEIRQRLDSQDARSLVDQGRIISLDRLLDETDMFNVAAASDLVTAPYPNHSGRSSIILWGAAAGRPVLTVDRGCIDRVVTTERLGVTCNVLDESAFAEAMGQSLAMAWSEEDAQRSRTYAQFHSFENYQRINSALVRQRLGLSEPSTR